MDLALKIKMIVPLQILYITVLFNSIISINLVDNCQGYLSFVMSNIDFAHLSDCNKYSPIPPWKVMIKLFFCSKKLEPILIYMVLKKFLLMNYV